MAPVIDLIDMRKNIPSRTWRIGRRPITRYVTIHYNGPAVPSFGNPKGEIDQLIFDARYHMRAGAFGVASGADGIQYHGATLSDGTNILMRDWHDMLWHCGNYDGNRYSISWHLPLGGNQKATDLQLTALFEVIEYMRGVYNIPLVNIKGHMEWKATACPGPYLMQHLREYRASGVVPKPIQWFKAIYNSNCRQGPSTDTPIALNGTAVMPKGTVFAVDKIIEDGKPYNGNPTWVHRADQLGFHHISTVAPYTE